MDRTLKFVKPNDDLKKGCARIKRGSDNRMIDVMLPEASIMTKNDNGHFHICTTFSCCFKNKKKNVERQLLKDFSKGSGSIAVCKYREEKSGIIISGGEKKAPIFALLTRRPESTLQAIQNSWEKCSEGYKEESESLPPDFLEKILKKSIRKSLYGDEA